MRGTFKRARESLLFHFVVSFKTKSLDFVAGSRKRDI